MKGRMGRWRKGGREGEMEREETEGWMGEEGEDGEMGEGRKGRGDGGSGAGGMLGPGALGTERGSTETPLHSPPPPPAPHSRWVPTHCSHSRAQLELPCNGPGGSFTPPSTSPQNPHRAP